MKKLIALVLLAASTLVQAGPYDLKINQRNATDDGDWAWLFPTPAASADGVMYLNGVTKIPGYLLVGAGLGVSSGAMVFAPGGLTSQYLRGDGSLATLPSSSFNFGDPSARTLAVSTSYQANDPSKAAVITVSPSCTNATTVLAASACTLQIRQHTSAVTCSTGTVVSTWSSTYALGLLLTNASGSPITINLGIGRYFAICPTAGTFTITTAVDQSAG